MPDPTKTTLSATQVPALFGKSPWVTRWMLHHHFLGDMPIEKEADARMSWGLKMEPLIVDQAKADLTLEVRPNLGQDGQPLYERRGLLGCTRDAIVIDPSLGPGALETKVVFDYRDWMDTWQGGQVVPPHYELQLQEQMMVGDESGPYKWGVVAVWIAGEVKYFRREPVAEVWAMIEVEAAAFFADLKAGKEPDPLGASIELPLLTARPRTGEILDLKHDVAYAQDLQLYKYLGGQRLAAERAEKSKKVDILKRLGDASGALCYGGITIEIKKSPVKAQVREATVQTRINIDIPERLPDAINDALAGKIPEEVKQP